MADNRKYYYIKLKENYFEQDNIKVLESMKNGHTYSLIIIKMYLKASKNNGQLMMTQNIPYDPSNVDVLASVIGHDIDHVKEAIRLGVQLDLIKVIDGRQIWMTEIQNMIGESSTEADRIRSYRRSLDKSVQMYNKSTPEKEREKDIDIKKEKDIEEESEELKQARSLASLLLSESRKHDDKFNIGKDEQTIKTWSNDIEKLIRIDQRDYATIEKVIKWCKETGNFWIPNILSGKKLREKFPTLISQMNSKKQYTPNKHDFKEVLTQEQKDAYNR